MDLGETDIELHQSPGCSDLVGRDQPTDRNRFDSPDHWRWASPVLVAGRRYRAIHFDSILAGQQLGQLESIGSRRTAADRRMETWFVPGRPFTGRCDEMARG